MSWSNLDDFLQALPQQAAEVRSALRACDGLYCLRTESRLLYLRLADGALSISDSSADRPDCEVQASEKQLLDLLNGHGNPLTALLMGRVRVHGDVQRLRKLISLVSH